jgi:hypothetical protein
MDASVKLLLSIAVDLFMGQTETEKKAAIPLNIRLNAVRLSCWKTILCP